MSSLESDPFSLTEPEGPHEDQPWLVIIDPQRIFADPTSDWGSPMWPEAVANIRRLARDFAGRIIVTRWVPPLGGERAGSWVEYMEAWPFADRAPGDPYLEVVDELEGVDALRLAAPTFGKWEEIVRHTAPTPRLVVTGVSTDCCVISTALPAADAGATLTVVSDACAGSTPENHAAAFTVMGLYPPQISIATTDEVLAAR